MLLGNLNATVAKSYDIFNLLQTAGYTRRLDLISFSGEGDTATLDSGPLDLHGLGRRFV